MLPICTEIISADVNMYGMQSLSFHMGLEIITLMQTKPCNIDIETNLRYALCHHVYYVCPLSDDLLTQHRILIDKQNLLLKYQLKVTNYTISYLSIRFVFLPVVIAPRNFNSSFNFATVNIANAMFTLECLRIHQRPYRRKGQISRWRTLLEAIFLLVIQSYLLQI